jgi:ribosome recycling factor
MAYNFTQIKQEAKNTEEWLKKELSSIRTGRANLSILDGVKVETYGSLMLISQVANLSLEDAKSLRITPWDMSVAKSIENGITTSDLGLSVSVDDKGLRVTFPELTGERRTSFVKLAKQKLEDARITLRGEREKVLKDIEKQEKDGKMSEDEKFRLKKDLEKLVDDTNKVLDEIFGKKEKEIIE